MATAEVLLEQLKNTDPNLRRKAIRGLTSYPENKEVVSALCDALDQRGHFLHVRYRQVESKAR